MDVSGEAASANTEDARDFKEKLHRVIVEEKYLPKQMFNVDEMCLLSEHMPEQTYIHQGSKTTPAKI